MQTQPRPGTLRGVSRRKAPPPGSIPPGQTGKPGTLKGRNSPAPKPGGSIPPPLTEVGACKLRK